MSEFETSRRNLFYGIAAAGAAVPVIAACGSSSDTDSPSGAGTTPSGSGTTAAPAGTGIPTSDIPVGGGAVYPDEKIVVTQPVAGEFKAFSAVCTHARCIVTEVKDEQIQCNGCHFSRFSITDGSVEKGPARSPLAALSVKVDGETLTVS